MNCHICEKSAKPGGTRYGIRPAVGVCHHCGIGICVEHSNRAKECAELVQSEERYPSHEQELSHPAYDR